LVFRARKLSSGEKDFPGRRRGGGLKKRKSTGRRIRELSLFYLLRKQESPRHQKPLKGGENLKERWGSEMIRKEDENSWGTHRIVGYKLINWLYIKRAIYREKRRVQGKELWKR